MANEFIIRKGFKSQEDSQITGSISLSGSFKDQENSPGTAGQVLSSTVSGSQWVDIEDPDAVTKTGTIVANQIAIWNNTTNQLRSDPTFIIDSNYKITLYQPNSSNNDRSSYNIGGGNIDNVTGQFNTGFGKNNLTSIVAGSQNIAIGANALSTNTDGDFNIAVGYNSLLSLTTGYSNTAYGNQTLQANTYASQNSAFGANALILNVSGASNTALGYLSLGANTSGPNNVAVGALALRNSTGTTNTAIGHSAGSAITTGDKNVIIGSNTGSTIATSDNNIIISDGDGNNRIQVNSGGNVGIGRTPSEKLHVQGNTRLQKTGIAGSVDLQFYQGNNASINNSVNYANIQANVTSGNTGFESGQLVFQTRNSGTTATRLTIASTGAATFSSSASNNFIINSTETNGGFINLQRGGANLGWIGSAYHTIAPVGANSDLAVNSVNGNLILATSSTERMRIDSSGRVGIGTTSPATPIDVSSASSTIASFRATGSGSNNKRLEIGSGGDRVIIKSFVNTTDAETAIAFQTGNTERMRITSGGDVILGPYNATPASTYNKYYYIKSAPYFWNCGNTYNPNYEIAAIAMGAPGPGQDDGEILFQTAQNVCSNNASSVLTTRARILETGEFEMYNGIKFPNQSAGSGTVSSSTLDAYEEGTWTPVVKFGTTVNNVGTIRALYTRIGRVVYIQCTMTSITLAGTGNLSIEGLPYTVGGNAFGDTQGNFRWGGIALSGAATHISAYFAQGGSNFFPQIIGTSGYISPVTNSGVSSTWNIYGISGFYMI